MDLGEKLLCARQEAGLSQRQLCGGVITRNMLSQIEHGTARPSMETLRYLAGQLGKPVSYFLEEDAALSPNQALMEKIRSHWTEENMEEIWVQLKTFQHPDPVLEWEWKCRSFLAALGAARSAVEAGKLLYARNLLEEAAKYDHGIEELHRQRLLLLGRIPGTDHSEIVCALPSLDEELLFRAKASLTENKPDRAIELLDAMEDREDPNRSLLLGRTLIRKKEYAAAVKWLQQAEGALPDDCMPLLEECFRELGDFKQAYVYACKQR